MAINAEQRIAKWRAKFNPERIKQTLEDQREQMLVQVEASFAALCAMEIKIKQVLDLSGIPTILYVPYLDYARQLHKLSRGRNISGDSFKREAQVLLDKWQARGLDPAVLATIRKQVFSVPAPAGP